MQQRMRYISDKLVTLAPGNSDYWWQRSFQYKHNAGEEERTLLKAYTLHPGYVIYWDALANFYCDHKQEDKMRKILEDARATETPNLLYWYQQKASYLYRLGKKEEAAQVFKEARAKGFAIVYK
jgi:tetratricopeptide (TPR) repeat protein